MRKKKPPEHVNHERWLVSYADFITLLFAFFVVMFAVSQVDTKRLGHFTEAFSKAVGISVFPLAGEGLLPATAGHRDAADDGTGSGPGELDQLRSVLDELSRAGASLEGLQIVRQRNELVLRLPEGVVFDTGDARVKPQSVAILKTIAPELRKREVEVRVEGHTDDRPISKGRFPSNWELSTARATAVLQVLLAEGMQPQRLSVAGCGEFRPIAPNATEDGRKQNRRVDLVVTVAVPVQPAEGT